MAWQGVNVIIVFWCFIDLVPSQNGKLISDLDNFLDVDSDSEVGQSEILAQDSRREMKSQLAVYCYNNSMKVILPPGLLSQVKILGFGVIESALESSCGYSLTHGHGHNILVVDYTGCHVTLEDGHYILRVLYPNEAGKLTVSKLSCDVNQSLTASLKLLDVKTVQTLPQPRTKTLASPPPSTPNLLLVNRKPGGCTFSADQRVPCDSSSVKQEECLDRGCCFDVVTSFCYYPMDECTADKNFVFAVYNDFANVPVNPMRFMVSGKGGCKPVISNNAFAIFKFSVTDCGTRSFVIGKMTIYLAEIETISQVLNLKYGMISRDNPIRLVVECRYQVSGGPVLASAGYMVMSPTLPPYLVSEGLYGVQLLISQDETFTKFYREFHQPLHVLLGKPVYLELRLRSPKSTASLLVHYCVAYPRSAKSALVLLFDGGLAQDFPFCRCPNPLDSGSTSILHGKHLPQNPYQRRFEIKAFQFMDLSTNKYLNEEVYFMCSTEVCMPSESPCAETCFDGKIL